MSDRLAKLILVEGMPGAGKSTLAHALLRQLTQAGVPVRWWYEEDAAHPIFMFDSSDQVRQVVSDLAGGHHQRVIEAALVRWRAFAASVASGDEVVIVDGSLFGYLTWSLFPFGVPSAEILDYVAEVADILAFAEPCVLYIRPGDVAASWQRLFAARGDDWATSAIQRATQSPYGRRQELSGFDGLIAYWRSYQALTDTAFARLDFPKLICAAEGGQADYLPMTLAFLDVVAHPEPASSSSDFETCVGVYAGLAGDKPVEPRVSLRAGSLSLSNMPNLWPTNRLIPMPGGAFAIESFPFVARFEGSQLTITGPELIGGAVSGAFERVG